MKNKRNLVHVYSGTQGSAGLYINEILLALNGNDRISQKAFVSYYYPFNNACKIFYKFTDLASGRRKTRIRPYLRYIEMIYALFRILCYIMVNRPKYVNYSLNSSYYPEYLFLKIVRKILGIHLIITCHDVVPFVNNYLDLSKENNRRIYLLNLADYLLVHNSNSKTDLINYYGIKYDKIISHPFPIMDLRLLQHPVNKKNIDFLFIGHLRVEKGIDILLNAWIKYHKEFPDATLYIVGNNPPNSGIMVDKYENLNITFILNYVDDRAYAQYIASAKCVVLPYIKGTNSGIPSSAYSLGTKLIVSDIPMFKNNVLIDRNTLFKSGDSFSLYEKMKEIDRCSSLLEIEQKMEKYHFEFREKVNKLYEELYNIV